MFLAFDPPTNVATTRLGSTCHRPMLGQSAITVFATRSAASNTGNRARKEAILMTRVTIRLCSERCRPYDSTRPPQSTRSSRNEQVRTLGKGGPIRRLLWPVGHNCVVASRPQLCGSPAFSLFHTLPCITLMRPVDTFVFVPFFSPLPKRIPYKSPCTSQRIITRLLLLRMPICFQCDSSRRSRAERFLYSIRSPF